MPVRSVLRPIETRGQGRAGRKPIFQARFLLAGVREASMTRIGKPLFTTISVPKTIPVPKEVPAPVTEKVPEKEKVSEREKVPVPVRQATLNKTPTAAETAIRRTAQFLGVPEAWVGDKIIRIFAQVGRVLDLGARRTSQLRVANGGGSSLPPPPK
jgi:hypothetical protein